MNRKNNTIRESLDDAAKRRNLQTVTLRGVTCYVRRMAAMLLLVWVTVTTAWADQISLHGWYYIDVAENKCKITGCEGTDAQKEELKTLTIPKIVDGKTVIGISSDALSGFINLREIKFYSDTEIENMPFVQNNTNLKTILLINDNGLTVEGGTNCLPASMTRIDNAFMGSGITTLTMPNVTSIGYHAFEGCNSLTSVTFGKAAEIENQPNQSYAFSKIGSACTVYYPGPMTNWNGYVCQYSPNLVVEGTYTDNDVEKKWHYGWCGDGWNDGMELYKNSSCLYWTLDNDGNLVIDCPHQDFILYDYFSKQIIKTTNWRNYNTPIKTITMNHVYGIMNDEFEQNPNLTTVNISSDLTHLSIWGFYFCTNLKDLYFDGTEIQWANVEKQEGWPYAVHRDFTEHWHCTVSFNSNGHDTAPAAQDIQWSNKDKATRPVDLSDNTYTFRGWFTDAACTKPWNFNTDIVPGDMTLYAGWKIRCAVTFDTNGHGTAPAAQENLWSNEDKVTEPDILSVDGYIFTGWYTDDACTTPWNFDNVVPGDMTLYAGWTDDKVAATVAAEGTVDIPYGQEWTEVTLTVNSLTMGWFQNTGKVGRLADEMKLTPLIGGAAGREIWFTGSNGHIVANQGVGNHTVDIDWSGYSDNITASGQTAKVWIHIPQATWDAAAAGNYSRTMDIDAAFWCNAVSPAERYNVENVATITFNLTVPEAVTLTFDANGGTGDAMDAVNGRACIAMTLPACTYSAPTGKTFLCWNTKADGKGWRYYPGDDFTMSETTTLYAEWGGEFVIDLTGVTEKVVSEDEWSLLTKLYGYYHYGDDGPLIDVNLDGEADLELLRPEWDFDLEKEIGNYAVKKLAGAANLSSSYRFLMPIGSGEAYESVLIIFGSGATVQQPAITQLFDNDTDFPNDLVGLKDGYARSIMIDGRTLYTDGDWNTLCLPFTVALEGSSLDGFIVKELDTETAYNGHVTGMEGSTLYLNFKDATSIEAGKPYIVKKTASTNITNPVFHGVTVNPATEEIPNPSYEDPEYITAAVPGSVSFNGGKFCGNYKTRRFDVEDQSVLFLGAANTLYYPKSGAKIGPFRSYFQIDTPNGIRAMVLGFGDDPASETTGIKDIDDLTISNLQFETGAWYSLDGMRLDRKPAKKGLYIHNGRKVAIK